MLLATVLLFLAYTIERTFSQKCVFVDACSCRYDYGAGSVKFGVEGGVIDLNRIGNGDPLFVDPKESGGKLFNYSPCSAYPCQSSKGVSKDSSVCLTDTKTSQSTDLGDLTHITFNTIVSPDKTSIHTSINYKTTGNNLTSTVHLVCSQSSEFRYEKNTSTNYEFSLYSPCACVDGCVQGISAGSILLIVFFITVAVYFAIGCIYKKAVYGATGQELIPNDKFWMSLPGLVKDGYLFFISPCLGDRANNRVYDRL